MNRPVKHVVIVGGGSAGWLTAGFLAAEHKANLPNALKITVLESPDVATIGVGEGTWPSMRNTLEKIGIKENDFIQFCNASFKQGSQFNQWVTGNEDDVYYHPFMTPSGFQETNLFHTWQQYKTVSFADAVNVQSHLCKHGLAPKQPQTPEYAGVANYGYHLDAGKFTEMLKNHCTQKLGVNYVQAHFTEVESAENGDIVALQMKDGLSLKGDLFVDCTGVRSLLLGQHFKTPYLSQKQYLFNDSALTLQLPYQVPTQNISSATQSTAQSAGWVWDIALSNRRGIGYTYASDYISDDEAQESLTNYIYQRYKSDVVTELNPRKLSFNPGYHQEFWKNNCVAIGMSAGFIEPLEASALAMVELSATMLSEELPVDRHHMTLVAKRFNARFIYRWERVIDFLKLHYVLSQRKDSAYWLDNKRDTSIPDSLAELIALWKYQSPCRHDIYQNEEVFPSASYQYVLYGMGFETDKRPTPRKFNDTDIASQYISHNIEMTKKYLSGLPSNRALLDFINNQNK